MRRLMGTCLLLSAVLTLPTVDSYAQSEKKDPPKVDSAKLVGEFVGTLKSTPGTDRIFVVETETKRLVQTRLGSTSVTSPTRLGSSASAALSMQRQLAADRMSLASARTPQQRIMIVQRIQRDTFLLRSALIGMQSSIRTVAPGYRIDTSLNEVEFQASEVAKVRTLVPPSAFDDKGNVKKVSKAELAALRGKDTNLPGFESSLEKLESGQKVRVVLGPAPKKDPNRSLKDEEPKDEKKMQVRLIVVLGEAAEETPTPGLGKLKKK